MPGGSTTVRRTNDSLCSASVVSGRGGAVGETPSVVEAVPRPSFIATLAASEDGLCVVSSTLASLEERGVGVTRSDAV